MKFYSVQIPYRGIIPILMRRGPIPSIELTIDQVNTMLEYKVPLLDPTNGKELTFSDFEENQKKTVEEKPIQKEAPNEKADPTPEPPINTTVKTDAPAQADIKEPEQPVDAATEEAISTNDEDDDTDTDSSSDNSGFDFTKIKNYSTFSKGKKRSIRARFAELKAQGMDINIIYATLNTEAKK